MHYPKSKRTGVGVGSYHVPVSPKADKKQCDFRRSKGETPFRIVGSLLAPKRS